jgi:hypothetical protein
MNAFPLLSLSLISLLAACEGPTGLAGSAGPTGDGGAAGTAGATGEAGPAGQAGPCEGRTPLAITGLDGLPTDAVPMYATTAPITVKHNATSAVQFAVSAQSAEITWEGEAFRFRPMGWSTSHSVIATDGCTVATYPFSIEVDSSDSAYIDVLNIAEALNTDDDFWVTYDGEGYYTSEWDPTLWAGYRPEFPQSVKVAANLTYDFTVKHDNGVEIVDVGTLSDQLLTAGQRNIVAIFDQGEEVAVQRFDADVLRVVPSNKLHVRVVNLTGSTLDIAETLSTEAAVALATDLAPGATSAYVELPESSLDLEISDDADIDHELGIDLNNNAEVGAAVTLLVYRDADGFLGAYAYSSVEAWFGPFRPSP